MKTKSHLKLRALCEGAIMVALAQVLSYLKLFELPAGRLHRPRYAPDIPVLRPLGLRSRYAGKLCI